MIAPRAGVEWLDLGSALRVGRLILLPFSPLPVLCLLLRNLVS